MFAIAAACVRSISQNATNATNATPVFGGRKGAFFYSLLLSHCDNLLYIRNGICLFFLLVEVVEVVEV